MFQLIKVPKQQIQKVFGVVGEVPVFASNQRQPLGKGLLPVIDREDVHVVGDIPHTID